MTADVTTVSFAQGTAPVGDTAVFEIFIKATPERIWEAITDPEQRATYSFGVQTHSDWTTGSSYRAGVPGVVDIAGGENVLVDRSEARQEGAPESGRPVERADARATGGRAWPDPLAHPASIVLFGWLVLRSYARRRRTTWRGRPVMVPDDH